MSPSPFLSPFIINWLASQALGRVEQEVVDEVRRRVETGDLGDYDGILFKKSSKSKDGAKKSADSDASSRENCADVGVVAASKKELVGIIDKIGVPKVTKGGDFKYYAGVWKGRKIALVETGSGFENARKGTEALIEVFRPARIVAVGFAAGLVPTLKSGALVVPNRILLEDGRTFDLARRLLDAENAEKSNETETPESVEKDAPPSFESSFLDRFATGALLSTERAVSTPDEKKRLAEKTGAAILDGASWAVAEVCAARNVPFLPLRVVETVRDETPPREVKNVVDSAQSPARMLGAFFGAVSKRPSSALDLYKLKERSLEAADRLAAALDAILNAQS